MTIKANTKKANTIKANTTKAETINANTTNKTTLTVIPNPDATPITQPVKTSSTKPRAAQSRSLKSLSSSSGSVGKLPEATKPFLSDLAHSPGAITSQKRVEAQQNFKPVEDIITAQIVGNDFSTGETKVRDGSGNIYSVTIGQQAFQPSFGGGQGRSASVVVGQSVIISRSRSQSGERTVRLVSVIPLGQSPKDALAALPGNPNVNDLCIPSQNATVAQRPKDEPETPEEPEIPTPPTEPSPNDPETEDDPPSKPFGCNPEDDAQWYNGENCPAGLESLGFAVLPDGTIKSLCRGPNRPPGDGCPESPDEYGWICSSGSCEYVPFGLYATKAECENVCTDEPLEEPEIPLSGFSCLDGNCVEDAVNPQFDTLEACNAARTPVYGEPPFTGGQCPSPATYSVTYKWNPLGPSGNIIEPPSMAVATGLIGPISSIRGVGSPSFQDIQILHGNGLVSTVRSGSCVQGCFVNVAIVSVTLDSGAPEDNCGDPQGPIIGYTC